MVGFARRISRGRMGDERMCVPVSPVKGVGETIAKFDGEKCNFIS